VHFQNKNKTQKMPPRAWRFFPLSRQFFATASITKKLYQFNIFNAYLRYLEQRPSADV
jgi:hypothetical protein